MIILIRKCVISLLVGLSCRQSTVAMASTSVNPIVLVHGGAGNIPESAVQEKIDGVKKAAKAGYAALNETGNVLDAIEAAIHIMEDDEAFNAGRGSALNLLGEVEMEALINEGKHLNAGAVTLVRNVKHPISVARLVMEKTPHTFLGGDGLNDFLNTLGVERVPEYSLLAQRSIDALKKFKVEGLAPNTTEMGKSEGGGTVGCVVVDSTGHVASGTSTGGITGKYKGRIGDTPLLGCGGYSDDETGAVSTTGFGESIMKFNLAQRILTNIQLGKSAADATKEACEKMTARVGKTAGAITVSSKGEVGVWFTSKRMAWAYQIDNQIHYGINPDEHFIETI